MHKEKTIEGAWFALVQDLTRHNDVTDQRTLDIMRTVFFAGATAMAAITLCDDMTTDQKVTEYLSAPVLFRQGTK